jgi:pyridoxal phosphate enzyme (YggS family)
LTGAPFGRAVDAAAVTAALERVRGRITGAGGDLERITLVAVTKGFDVDAVRAVRAAGVADLGENYAQELRAKADALDDAGARWHFVGHVQRNKIPLVGADVALWHGVDRLAVGGAIARRAPGAEVLVQVDITGEPQKAGCPPAEVPGLVEQLRAVGLDVRGLMAMGPAGPPEDARSGFRLVSGLADDLGLDERSMGMSDDLEVAVEEGATMVRIGRALLGPRPAAARARR